VSQELDIASLGRIFAAAADPAAESLAWAYRTFGDAVTLASSFSVEDILVIDGACRAAAPLGLRPHVFMLDTGRLHPETYDTAAAVRARLPIDLTILSPDAASVEAFVAAHGPNAFYDSPSLRHACCELRKVRPLARALAGRALWVTGLRRSQAPTRRDVPMLEWDAGHGLWKLNPLIDLTEQDVLGEIAARELPSNPLQKHGFRSLGCAPCTRAIGPDDDLRAGRWWWEEPEHRECGLHLDPARQAAAPREPAANPMRTP
jgi:phosphoadenosine phosphosulfate reductase